MHYQKQYPLSPFLTIYKPQFNSIISIFERITGIILLFFIFYLCFFLCVFEEGLSFYNFYYLLSLFVFGESYLLLSFYIFFSFSLCYHLLFSVRYIFWNVTGGKHLNLDLNYLIIIAIYWFFPFLLTIFNCVLNNF